MDSTTVGGVDIHYYALCKRKLWLYNRGIAMEQESDRVLEGTLLHESAYSRNEKREILIDNSFKIDMIDGEYIREIKLSSKMTEADRMQMLYYLYQLDLRDIKKKGLISYTKEKKTEKIILTDKDKELVKQAIAGVYSVINLPNPPSVKKLPYCKSCAYYDFCFALEVNKDEA